MGLLYTEVEGHTFFEKSVAIYHSTWSGIAEYLSFQRLTLWDRQISYRVTEYTFRMSVMSSVIIYKTGVFLKPERLATLYVM